MFHTICVMLLISLPGSWSHKHNTNSGTSRGGGGGGQNGIEDPINYGTFSTQKYEVQQVHQHTKGGGGSGLLVMQGGY